MKKYLLTLIILMFGMQGFSKEILTDLEVANEKQPTRIEKREFDGISSINLIQKYGNIVMQEGQSNKVSLEIQYFDYAQEQAKCSVSTKGNELRIETIKSGGQNNSVKVNYILVIPKQTNILGVLSYGSMMIGGSIESFDYKLDYANLVAKSFSAKSVIKAMYSNIMINKCSDITIEGTYNQYKIKEVNKLSLPDMKYSNAVIDNLKIFEGNLAYSRIDIQDVESTLSTKLAYSGIKMKSRSNKISEIQIDGSYSDINIDLPQNIQAKVSFVVRHGKVNMSKYFEVKYALDSRENFIEEKKGRIGTKTSSLNMTISNRYADINIQTTK